MKIKHACVLGALATLATLPILASPVLVNGDFQTGDLSGWTTFVTAGGNTYPDPAVSMFDTANDGSPSFAAKFSVGRAGPPTGMDEGQEGGGIYQNVFFDFAGNYTFTANIASLNPHPDFGNAQGGLFKMLLDGNPVATWDFGSLAANATEYYTLSGDADLTAGVHELRFEMTRSFFAYPIQYIDNVSIAGGTAVPESSPMLLLCLFSMVGLVFTRRRIK